VDERNFGEFFAGWRLNPNAFSGYDRMLKVQFVGAQKQPLSAVYAPRMWISVVPHNSMADSVEVAPELVGSPGQGAEQREAHSAASSNGTLCEALSRRHGLLPFQWPFQEQARRQGSMHQCQVRFVHPPLGK
jgi:hypothetical protein